MTSVRQPARRVAGAASNLRDSALWIRDNQGRLLAYLVAVVAFLWAGHFRPVAGLLIAILFGLGVQVWWQARRDLEQPRWWQPRRVLGMVLLPPAVLTLLALALVPLSLVSLLTAVCIVAVAHALEPAPEAAAWWAEETLKTVLFGQHGVLPRRDDVVLSRLGQPQPDGNGHAVTFTLPGCSWEALQAKHRDLAAALGVSRDQLQVRHDPAQPENVVTLWVGTPARTEAVEGVLSPLCTAERTDATQPVRIGVDELTGEVLFLDLDEANDLIAGVPGAGKTELVRLILGAYLLDPRARVFALDGKGSRRDYQAAAPLCERFVWGTDEDAPQQLEQMLADVLALVRTRNSTDDGLTDWPPVLLLAEELQDVRAGADKGAQERLDDVLGRIVRMGRAVRTKLLVSTQRTSVDDLPSRVRNLITQRVALRTIQPGDYALVLGVKPDVRLPTRKQGQGVLRAPGGLHALVPDRMPLPEWRALCARAAALRGPQVVNLAKAPRALTLHDAAARLLAAGPLQPSALFERLPEQVRPADASAMGRALREDPRFASRRSGTARHWTLAGASSEAVLGVNGGGASPASPASSSAVGAP